MHANVFWKQTWYLHVTRKTQNSNVERGSKMIGLIIIIIYSMH